MNYGLRQLVVVFFAACFMALQFPLIDETQFEQYDKRIFHIEEVSTSGIDKPIDNRFIYVQHIATKNKRKLQRQYIAAIEQQVEQPFRQFMLECLDAICQDYQNKLSTSFKFQKKRELSFELDPILISNLIQVHIEESDGKISLI